MTSVCSYFVPLRSIGMTMKVRGWSYMSETLARPVYWGGHMLRVGGDASAEESGDRGWSRVALSKVPEVAIGFWIIKIAATTLGETAGDALSMGLGLGYLTSTVIFFGLFLVLVVAQIRAKRFHPYLYWGVVVGTTLAGTTMADFADRSLGIGYPGGTSILFGLVIASLVVWKLVAGTVSVNSIVTPKAEMFYWLTILFSNTLGTALGDWTSEGTGFGGGVFLFIGLLAVIAALYFFTKISRTVLFWVAFILTRPLGASMGDLLTKPHGDGGFGLSRFVSSAVIAVFMVVCILLFPQRAGDHPVDTPGRDA
jgi:uncharacterized membrane-anchored protein